MKPIRFARPLVPLALFAASLGLVSAPRAAAEDQFVAVKITDMQKNEAFKAMSAEEFKALDAQIRLETRFFPKAQELAKKDWKEDDTNKSPYPGGRLNPRKVDVLDRGPLERIDKKVEAASKAEEKRQGDSKKTPGKMSEQDKKQALAKADKERELRVAADLVKTKLDDLIAREKEAAEKAATGKPADPPAAP